MSMPKVEHKTRMITCVKGRVGYVVTRSCLRKRDHVARLRSEVLERHGPTALKRRFSLPPSHVLLPSPHPCLFSFVVKGSVFVVVARSFPPSGSTERGIFIGALNLAVRGARGMLHAEKGDSQAVLHSPSRKSGVLAGGRGK
jgi:hypothetical protein